MKHGFLILAMVAFVVGSMVLVFAQNKPMEEEDMMGRMGRGMGRGMGMGQMGRGMGMGQMGRGMGMGMTAQNMNLCPSCMGILNNKTVMQRSGDSIYLLRGSTIYKVNTTNMQLNAKRNLYEADKTNEAVADKIIMKNDINKDGKLSKEECGMFGVFFQQMDKNTDGFVTREDILEELMSRPRLRGVDTLAAFGNPQIEVDANNCYVYLAGTVHKLKASDLSTEAMFEIKDMKTPTMSSQTPTGALK